MCKNCYTVYLLNRVKARGIVWSWAGSTGRGGKPPVVSFERCEFAGLHSCDPVWSVREGYSQAQKKRRNDEPVGWRTVTGEVRTVLFLRDGHGRVPP